MPITMVVCHKCKNEIKYDEVLDKQDNDIIQKKIRKVVVDPNNVSVPFYAMPPDKRRLVDEKFIKFECNKCPLKMEK